MRRVASIYMFVQGAIALAWWILLFAVPAARAHFKSATQSENTLLSFWLADLVCVAGGSILAGRWMLSQDRRAHSMLWFTAGALVYAALYCVGLTLFTGDAILATACMVPSAVITFGIASRATRS